MAASSVQPAGTPVMGTRPVPGSGNFHYLAPQQLLSGNSKFVRVSSLPSNAGGLRQCEAQELSSKGIDICAPQLQRARQELLWRQFFLNPTLWLDHREDKQSSRFPDFTQKESEDVLLLNNLYKPSWVDEQLARWDKRIRGSPAPSSNSTLPKNSGTPKLPGHEGEVTTETVSTLCEKGKLSEAVDALSVLVEAQSRVPVSLFYTILKSCVAQKNLVLGRRVHDLTVRNGYESNVFLANHIMRMYASRGGLQEATAVFTRVAIPNAYMWSAIISAHAKHGEPKQAIQLYQEMRKSRMKPDGHVFVAALQACASAADLESGKQVHADVLEAGVQTNLFVGNCLIDMYAKCGRLDNARLVFDTIPTKNVVSWNAMIAGYAKSGSLEDARRLFDSSPERDVVTWTAMIVGYVEHERSQEALTLYDEMEQEGTILADAVAFACLLTACARVGDLQQGKRLHSQILKRGLEADIVVRTCLVDMYAKCGKLEDARQVFDSLPKRDVVTWNAMIAGYAEGELGQEAICLYEKMEEEGMISADGFTFACLLKACGRAGALQQGKRLHSQVLKRGLEAEVVVANSLLDMYVKCGRLEDAQRLFDSLPTRDVVTWNVMINGFGQSNEAVKAIACFQEMLRDGVVPEETTFTCLLVACSHEGLVNEGRQYFQSMVDDRGISPTVQHYTCMVDLLGRSGHLDDAEKMLSSFEGNDVGLLSLLNACKSHGDIERGTRCFERLVRLDPQDASAYVLMANIYADAGMWTDVDRVEGLRKAAGASKKPAKAGIEVNRHVHTFVVGEERGDISSKVRNMNALLKEGGHVPHTELVLKPVSQKEKEDDLCGHAEKLALAYGLLNTPDGTPLLVTKNLRMCGDCHSSTEIMSRIEKREIVVRDSHRVHRFVGGSCACGGRP